MKGIRLFMACVAFVGATSFWGQGLHGKIDARAEESAKPSDVPGGVAFTVPIPADKAFDLALKYFQLHDLDMDDSSKKDLGQLVSTLKVVKVGGFKNNNLGFRTYVTVIKESETSATIKVKVTEQKRTNHLQPEPWTEPQVLDKESNDTADQLKASMPSS
jgi:hypothetical protein